MGDIYHEQHVNKDVTIMSNPYSDWTFAPDYNRMIADLKTAVQKAMD